MDFCALHLEQGHGGEGGELDYVFDPSWFYSSDTDEAGAEAAGASPWSSDGRNANLNSASGSRL